MKLWEKAQKTEEKVLKFSVGRDPEFDRMLAPYDVIGSMAHAIMLGETGLIDRSESESLVETLAKYYPVVRDEAFQLREGEEDIHSHLESYLVEQLGDTGKKIHTARSRNDQVLTAMQLMMKEEYRRIIERVSSLFDLLVGQAEKFSIHLLPGYTHTQVAMPSSFGLWLGAYAESLVNDLLFSTGITRIIDQNPLGSAAGFGSSFPIDRDLTTKLLGFGDLQVSPVVAQLNRGKVETLMAQGLAAIATTLSRLSADMILFMSQEMKFISFSEQLTTGSSIMPHKKNPDVLELIRAHSNTVIHLPASLAGLSANLISGYHRDLQLTKELLMPGIDKVGQCLEMMEMMVGEMNPATDILNNEKYDLLYSVEEVNRKVMKGLTFRDAYREVADEIAGGSFRPGRGFDYTHVGSIGNPGIERISEKIGPVLKELEIKPAEKTFEYLKNYYIMYADR